MTMVNNAHFGFGKELHPTKGPKGDTAFLTENYKYLGIGGIFRTPKARFSPKQIHAGAKKAGAIVEIKEEGPWLRVKMTGKIPPPPRKPAKPDFYFGAGQVYPKVEP
jgi:hypothetical protein